MKSAGDNPNEATQTAIDEITEKMELEFQRSQMLLDTLGDIKIKMNPDYINI